MNLDQMLSIVLIYRTENPDRHGQYLANPHYYAGYDREVAFEDVRCRDYQDYVSIEDFVEIIEETINDFSGDTPVHIAKKNCHGVELTEYRLKEILR